MCQPYNSKKEVLVPEEYEALWYINNKCLDRVIHGKGKERHFDGKPFEQQDICAITREEGWGYPIGQARKKLNEARRMFAKGDKSRAINEVLDASIYLQALALVMEEQVLEIWQETKLEEEKRG